MTDIVLRVPEETALLLHVSAEEAGRKLQMAAVKLSEVDILGVKTKASFTSFP